MGYEFMMGVRPYLGSNRKEIKEKVMAKQAVIHRKDIKIGWGVEAADFINRLIQRKPGKRLGAHGIAEVKNHIWFKNYNWNDLYNKKLIAPFIPNNEDNFDYKYCNNVEKQGLKTKERYAEICISDNYKTIFNNYLYFNRNDLKNKKDENLNKNYIYPNIHEKMYIPLNPHNRNKSVVTDFSNYRRFSNKSKFDMNGGEINLKVNHGRAFSSMGIGPNKAFLEANKYINSHKIKKISILNNNKYNSDSNKIIKNALIKNKTNTNTNITKNIAINNTNNNMNKTNIVKNNINTNYNVNIRKNKVKIFMHINHNRSKNKSTINGMGLISNKEKEKENFNYNNVQTDKNYCTVKK